MSNNLNHNLVSKSVKGTRTEQNLLKSFAGESQARMRYDFFAGAARSGGNALNADMFMNQPGLLKIVLYAFIREHSCSLRKRITETI
jgi:Holliday junction resolvasome RuvABC ATP-dependent DNA helicase subunit